MSLINPWLPPLVILTTLGSSLMAGLFFIFSNTVIEALSALPEDMAISAMQAINRVIINPLFLVVFMGTGLLSLGVIASSLARWGDPGSLWALVGALVYLAGGLTVTIVGNVPLNEQLALVDPLALPQPSGFGWTAFTSRWLPLNHLRTFSCTGAVLAFLVSLLRMAA